MESAELVLRATSNDFGAPRLRSNSEATTSVRSDETLGNIPMVGTISISNDGGIKFGTSLFKTMAESDGAEAERREDCRIEPADAWAESLVKFEGSDWLRRAPSRKI